jgi:hypothetical protein
VSDETGDLVPEGDDLQAQGQPPRYVLRAGLLVGGVEGTLLGILQGGFTGAASIAPIGAVLGLTFAALAWRVRTSLSGLFLGLLLGCLAEAAGCLLVWSYMRTLAREPWLMFTPGGMNSVSVAVFLARGGLERQAQRCEYLPPPDDQGTPRRGTEPSSGA